MAVDVLDVLLPAPPFDLGAGPAPPPPQAVVNILPFDLPVCLVLSFDQGA